MLKGNKIAFGVRTPLSIIACLLVLGLVLCVASVSVGFTAALNYMAAYVYGFDTGGAVSNLWFSGALFMAAVAIYAVGYYCAYTSSLHKLRVEAENANHD